MEEGSSKDKMKEQTEDGCDRKRWRDEGGMGEERKKVEGKQRAYGDDTSCQLCVAISPNERQNQIV